jgi:RimJ/RimL family protein N-acetyltransferase
VKRVLTGQDELFGPWLLQQLNSGEWFAGRGSTIGLWEDGKGPIAACLYEGCNDASIMLHTAGIGKNWLNREFLWFVFYYPFVQLKLSKIISPVESTNTACRKFIEHIGFVLEATLKNAAPKGDLLIYTMGKDQCKWLNLKDRNSEQTESASTA